MKRIFLIAVLGLIMNVAPAQVRTSVPDWITVSFKKEYPHAKHVAWTVSQEKYLASFESRKKKFFVEYDNMGRAVGQTVTIEKIRHPWKKQERYYTGHLMTIASCLDSNNGCLHRPVFNSANHLPQSA